MPEDPAVPMARVIGLELELLGSHGMQAHAYPRMLELVRAGCSAPTSWSPPPSRWTRSPRPWRRWGRRRGGRDGHRAVELIRTGCAPHPGEGGAQREGAASGHRECVW
ncbi:hypothetical protein O1M63_15040 [Streptomyces mirabilis]|nr:hypothetical protein [Streptomyces mirabilis]